MVDVMAFYDLIYYASYAAAPVAFAVFSRCIRYRLVGGKKFLAYIVFCSLLFSSMAIIHVWHGEKRWETFKQQYRCKIIDKADGYPLNAEYGKTAYRCSNNFIYWR